MKSRYFLLFYFSCTCWKQEFKDTTKLWTKGNLSLLFNQSTQQTMAWGGTSNMAGNFGINYDFNYKRVL
jgi:hypothetical protein